MSAPTRLYIGRLAPDVVRDDIEHLFRGLGRIIDVRMMSGFGFVEFEDSRDAEDAVRVRVNTNQDFDGVLFMGERIIVQFAKQPPRRERDRERERDQYAPRGYPGRSYESRPPRGPRRGEFRIVVFNLPPGTSWQDLKDIGREYGSITFSEINPSRSDEGAIEYDNADDFERALAKIEGFELRGYRLRAEPVGDLPPPPPRDDRWNEPRRGDDHYDGRAGRNFDRYEPPARDGRGRYDREALPPRDEREPLPPRDDVEERAPMPSRDNLYERAPMPPRDDVEERAPLPPRDDDNEERAPLPPRDELEPPAADAEHAEPTESAA